MTPRSAASHPSAHRLLALHVQGAGGFIQDEDAWVPHEGPGNGQPLFLSHSQLVPFLPYI